MLNCMRDYIIVLNSKKQFSKSEATDVEIFLRENSFY